MPTMTKPIIARPRRASPILVCKKCLKRAPAGAEVRRELKSALKHRPSGALKRSRLVSTSCFGICPKRAVVMASAQSLQAGEYILVSHRRQVDDALEGLSASTPE